jgi:tripartite-type tricarboxylate transporter receptor subunit TctC
MTPSTGDPETRRPSKISPHARNPSTQHRYDCWTNWWIPPECKGHHVPYKGTTDGIVDVLAGRSQMMFSPIVTSLPHYRADKIEILGVTGARRSSLMPAVPTFTELGYPTLDISTWFALIGPAGIPDNVVKVMTDGVAKAFVSKDVTEALMNQGVEPAYGSPAELAAFLKADSAIWSKLTKELGVKQQ